ncbi:MAG: tetratricopeptide repeat protein [Candidatus Krumholzibacteriota bacterium]
MSLWGRILGNRRNRACAEGVSLLEQGRYAEAVDLLRKAALDSSAHPTGSLASFHFRQALVAQGRRHLQAGDNEDAIRYFDEAVEHWDQYPDLHCLLGASRGRDGDWDAALNGARTALRRNPDYAEARLLETVALQKLERLVEAADSLNALVESGRRVEHWLISGLEGKNRFTPQELPDDLEDLLINSLSGHSEKEEVAAAVAQCRAGHWQEGLDRFADLVKKRPRYPDYRTRHSAALFQVGRNTEALAEVDAALALNETYRTAINLKGLILADVGRLREAREFLEAADDAAGRGSQPAAHEELFGAYLRGVLALLSGRPRRVEELLGPWGDLVKNFARAELLLAAAEDLRGSSRACGLRLAGLAEEWTAEPIYFFLLASHHLRERRYEEAAGVLGRWPASSAEPDRRPLYLEAHLALAQGKAPELPAHSGDHAPEDEATEAAEATVPRPEAWEFLTAQGELMKGEGAAAWKACDNLIAGGFLTEPVVVVQVAAAALSPEAVPDAWNPPAVRPESCLPGMVYLSSGEREGGEAADLLEKYHTVHPEQVTLQWLRPAFWFDPVRNWIA